MPIIPNIELILWCICLDKEENEILKKSFSNLILTELTVLKAIMRHFATAVA